MNTKQFPAIDPIATGKNIIRLRVERGMSVRDLQDRKSTRLNSSHDV